MPTTSEMLYLITEWRRMLCQVFTDGSYSIEESDGRQVMTAKISWQGYVRRYTVSTDANPVHILERMKVGTRVLKGCTEREFDEDEPMPF